MKSLYLFIALAAAVAICALAGTEPDSRNPADREAGELRNQINELQARVNLLETRLSWLESTADKQKWEPAEPQSLPFLPPPPAILGSPSPGRPRPEIWGKRQINGWTFYMIPCHADPALSAPAPAGSR